MHNPAPVLENNTHKLLWDFDIHTDQLISARRPDLTIFNKNKKKKKKICKIVDFAVSADHRIKLKECEKKYKYLDLAGELKKLWNMLVKIIPIVIGEFGTVTKGLLKGLEDLEVGEWVETIQTTTLLRTARILRSVLETCCHSECYIVICSFMQKYTYICWIRTDAIIIKTQEGITGAMIKSQKQTTHARKTQEDFFIKYFTSHLYL